MRCYSFSTLSVRKEWKLFTFEQVAIKSPVYDQNLADRRELKRMVILKDKIIHKAMFLPGIVVHIHQRDGSMRMAWTSGLKGAVYKIWQLNAYQNFFSLDLFSRHLSNAFKKNLK